jgi:hypothetical protein
VTLRPRLFVVHTFARSIVSNANFLSLSRLSMLLSDAPAAKDGGRSERSCIFDLRDIPTPPPPWRLPTRFYYSANENVSSARHCLPRWQLLPGNLEDGEKMISMLHTTGKSITTCPLFTASFFPKLHRRILVPSVLFLGLESVEGCQD